MKPVFKIYFFPAVVFSSVIFLLPSCGSKNDRQISAGKPGNTSALSVEAIVVKPKELHRKINVTGTIIANEESELHSEVSGKITGIYFDEGAIVKKGQLLVKINDSDLQAQYKKLVFQDTLLSRDEFRKRKLLEINAISKEEYDNIFIQLQSVKAEAELIRAQLQKTEIYAPFDGIIGLRNISDGSFVNPNLVIAAMQQVNPVKIEFSVPERYHKYLKAGVPVHFTVTGSEEAFTGIVYAVEAKIDPVTRTIKVRAKSENDKNKLVPGAFAKVEIVLEKMSRAIAIPSQSIIPEMNGQKVFLVKNGKAVSTPVEPGIRTDIETEIINGVTDGDTLAVTGLLQLRDGIDVNAAIR